MIRSNIVLGLIIFIGIYTHFSVASQQGEYSVINIENKKGLVNKKGEGI